MKTRVLILLLAISSYLSADVKGIDTEELVGLQKVGIKIIDIRKQEEIDKHGIIPGSYKLNFYKEDGKINKELWLLKFVNLVKSRQVKFVLISKDGSLAKKGALLLEEKKKYSNPLYLKGGINTWLNEKRKTIK